MDAITQAEIFALIAEINSFADSSETLINNSRSTYEQNKQALLNRHRCYHQRRLFVLRRRI